MIIDERTKSGYRERPKVRERRDGAHGLAGAVTGGLGAIAAGGHVAPATTAVLGAVQEHATTAWVAAAADAAQLTGDQRVGTIVHDGHHQRGKGIAAGDEIPLVAAVRQDLETASSGTSAQDTIDLGHGFGACIRRDSAMFGECPERAAHPSRVEQCCGGTGGLLLGASHDGHPSIMIDHADSGEPLQHRREVSQRIAPDAQFDVIGIDEVQPESITDENERTVFYWDDDKCRHGVLRSRYDFEVTPQLHSRKPTGRVAGCLLFMTATTLLPGVARVIVGSLNPVKIAAVQAVLARCGRDITVGGIAVASGVPDQPWGDEDTRAGALARAQAALGCDADAQLGVGLEGGVVRETDGSVRTCAWAVVVDRRGMSCSGGSLAMALPPAVVALLEAGVELGHAMDEVARTVNTKHGQGAVGLLTAGLITRQGAYEPLVTYALSRWIGRELWDVDSGGR